MRDNGIALTNQDLDLLTLGYGDAKTQKIDYELFCNALKESSKGNTAQAPTSEAQELGKDDRLGGGEDIDHYDRLIKKVEDEMKRLGQEKKNKEKTQVLFQAELDRRSMKLEEDVRRGNRNQEFIKQEEAEVEGLRSNISTLKNEVEESLYEAMVQSEDKWHKLKKDKQYDKSISVVSTCDEEETFNPDKEEEEIKLQEEKPTIQKQVTRKVLKQTLSMVEGSFVLDEPINNHSESSQNELPLDVQKGQVQAAKVAQIKVQKQLTRKSQKQKALLLEGVSIPEGIIDRYNKLNKQEAENKLNCFSINGAKSKTWLAIEDYLIHWYFNSIKELRIELFDLTTQSRRDFSIDESICTFLD